MLFRSKIIFEGIKFFLKIAFNSTINKHPYDYQSNFGSHVTLNNTKKTCKTVYKYIESSISQQFKLSNYDLLLSLLKSRIKDRIFTNLICEYLKIKFCKFSKNIFMSAENTQKNTIFSILHDIQNVFFDSWVKKKLLIDFNKRKKFNFKYFRFYKIKFNNKSSILRPISDLKHRHAHYFRYLNNFTVGVNGSKRNCMKILKKIRNFLKKKLNLNLNVNQTEINCVENKSILLFDFTIQKTKLKKVLSLVRKNKIFKCDIFKFIFKTFVANIINKLKFEGYIKNNRPICNIKLINNQLTEITKHYKIIERKILDYYFFFDNFKIVAVQIRYMLKSSYILTIASKMKFKTKKQVFREYNKI